MHMMDTPLLLTSFLNRAERFFHSKKIYSRTSATTIHEFTYKEYVKRTRRLADALTKLGMDRGMKVGTFAWNHHRHLEAYFAVPCAGAVLHMINIRLSPEHIAYVINHAEDEILLIDDNLVPLIAPIVSQLKTVKHYIIMGDAVAVETLPIPNALSYESLLAEADEHFTFPEDLDENTPAGMCYTSATTGMPKGVVYTHRSIVLHSLTAGLADSIAICESDVVLPVVPMFHANAWGLPFASVAFGSTQVLPGPMFTPQLLLELFDVYKVTLTAGVPTIWLGVLQEQRQNPRDLSSMRLIVCGGSASPIGLVRGFEQELNIPYMTGYGMTETSPLVSLSTYLTHMQDYTADEKMNVRITQGMTMPLIDTRIVNENGEVPWDGKTMGELTIRGPWIANEYYQDERTEEAFKDGWLYTGDIAVMTTDGYIKITDRTKDLIKSGGEWISSVELENALMSHPKVFEAAVIAIPHEKWLERPLACVVAKPEFKGTITKEELLESLQHQFHKSWVPDDIVFIDEVPKTSVGKFLKAKLREDLKEYRIQV
ncbi:long-chain fatty acid--CoA ligase [Lysinibacillus sp. OL1_EC]|uniref:long-chain fatty acid--CoA ligase n=1 Tax=unclassified Lysinibacillus TaxID=2636778 RepID=UPI00103C1093|nr:MULTISPECIES: long-chain fatty acid--CoA ligase [unclassified Lysinibacillus]MCM0623486.1 long-chain fatty acid--CoA ligase [Lysinibacillus sp. OL1_EC]TBV89605.1 fatty-acid--CoA ligase [Lysinibacillus sp. OL1]WGT39672.1 long-chain fatty acid--CoA ligase [Lysinibacillus sp. 1 U-2021]